MLCYSTAMITPRLGVSIYAASNKHFYQNVIKSSDVTKSNEPVNQTPVHFFNKECNKDGEILDDKDAKTVMDDDVKKVPEGSEQFKSVC